MTSTEASTQVEQDAPDPFRRAVAALSGHTPRAEISVEPITAPRRLAPHAYAFGAEVQGQADELATARLILLHDPDRTETWGGELRLVAYLRAEIDRELAADPLLVEVGWSWLTEALDAAGARYTALGGTVTQTSSARFGAIEGPEHTDDLELRASWTAPDPEVAEHAEAFCGLLAAAVGLPPVGISTLHQRRG